MAKKFKYQCTTCKQEYLPDKVFYLCPACNVKNTPDAPPKGVLKVIYNYSELRRSIKSFEKLKQENWLDLLPINDLNNLPRLKTGDTPLYPFINNTRLQFDFNLYFKDDSRNPTYSFKDRASALVSAFAKENGIDRIVTASTGNAGSSLSGICASQGQKAIVLVPASAPVAKLTQILMYGAAIIPVLGNYDDTFDLSVEITQHFGIYNRNTAYNPLTIEGKKTVSFELYDQFQGNLPDRIFVPVGDGVILAGVYKGFEDLLELGLIGKIPVIVAVQSNRSDNLIRNLNKNQFEVKPGQTIADSISVDFPRNFYMAKDYLEKYKGEYISVTDAEILSAVRILASNTGLFAEPAAAAAFAGVLKYNTLAKIRTGSNNVVLLTGSGLKDIKTAIKDVVIPEAIIPDIRNIKKEIFTS
ncbi:MAG: threonine synthase [Bacteroidales bacterium]|nr:threonine synthase [Bacteroidales bacterium]